MDGFAVPANKQGGKRLKWNWLCSCYHFRKHWWYINFQNEGIPCYFVEKQTKQYIYFVYIFVIRHLIETALTYLGEVLQQSWYFNIVFIEYVFSVFLNELTIPENCWYIEQVSLSVVYSRFLEDGGAQPKCVAVSPV